MVHIYDRKIPARITWEHAHEKDENGNFILEKEDIEPLLPCTVSLDDLGKGMNPIIKGQNMVDLVGLGTYINLVTLMQRLSPETLVKTLATKRAFLTVRGLLGKGGIHCNAYCAFIRSMGGLSEKELEFWSQKKAPVKMIESHLRGLPVAHRENYYLAFSPEDRYPGDVSVDEDLVLCTSASSSGRPAVVLRSKKQFLKDREAMELQLRSTLKRGETIVLVRTLCAERGVPWGSGTAIATLMKDLQKNPHRLFVDYNDYGSDWRLCAQELVQTIREWSTTHDTFPHTIVYANPGRSYELFNEMIRIDNSEPFLQTVRERIHIANTGMPFDVERRIHILKMLGAEPPLQLDIFQDRTVTPHQCYTLKIYAEFILNSFGAAEYNTGFSGTPLTNMLLLVLEAVHRVNPALYTQFCHKWFNRGRAPRAVVKASNPALHIYVGSWKEEGIPATTKKGCTGPGFATTATGGVANVYIGDEYALIIQKDFLKDVKIMLGVDVEELMKRIGLKKEGAAPLLWIMGRVDAVYFCGIQVFEGDVLRGLEGTEQYLRADFVLQEVHGKEDKINVYVATLNKKGKEKEKELKFHIIKGMIKKNINVIDRLRALLDVPEDASEDIPALLAAHPHIHEYITVVILPEKEFDTLFRSDERSRIKPRTIWEPEGQSTGM